MSSETSIERQLGGLRHPAPRVVLAGVELAVGLADGYATFESPLGEVAVSFNPWGVSGVDLFDDRFEERFAERFRRRLRRAAPPRGWGRMIERALQRGRPGDLPLDLRRVSRFRAEAMSAAANIPQGEVRPYSWVAREAGHPQAVRAVGSAMARNPVPLIVPCHRVVRSDGRLGEYSLGGPHEKWMLLRHEGVDPERLEKLAAAGIRLVGSATTGVYCHPTCHHARRITDRHLVRFRGVEEAEGAGYRPCSHCRP